VQTKRRIGQLAKKFSKGNKQIELIGRRSKVINEKNNLKIASINCKVDQEPKALKIILISLIKKRNNSKI
jgi:hypothetical protein